MKRIFQLLFATVFLLNFQTIQAQPCIAPTDVILLVPFGGGIFDNPLLQWDYNESCPLEYFEIEYGYAPFTPGMGEGTLISPVNPNPPYMYTLDGEATHAWIRAVCDPECDGNVGGEITFGSNWVQAEVVIIAPYVVPDGVLCEDAPNQPVQSYTECEYQQTYSYEGFFFLNGFDNSAEPNPVTVPCSEEGVFVVYQKFTATDAGVVEISVEGNDESDHGLIVYEGPCSEGAIVDCAESFTNSHTLQDLTPGQEYYVGFWQNGFMPWMMHYGDWLDFNYFYLTTKICEPGCGDFTITAGPDTAVSCDNVLPDPEYTVEGLWCTGYTVSVETSGETECGATVTRTYTATDSLGNTASDTQLFVLTDDQPPVAVSVPEDLIISCGEDWQPESPEFADNCTAQMELTYALDTIFIEGCEMFIEEIWQATDSCGNATTVSRSISVKDELPPELICPDSIAIFVNDPDGVYELADLTSEAQATDNCAETVSVTQSLDPGTELLAGTHTIALVASDGCFEITCEIVVNVSVLTGIHSQENLGIILYPNPSNGMINIQRKDSSPLQVDVFDSRGRMVYSNQFNDQNFNLNLDHSASGIYTVRMKSEAYTVVEQIVLK